VSKNLAVWGFNIPFFPFLPLPLRGRGTYTAGTVNSVPLLKVRRKTSIFGPTFDDVMSPKCTKLHIFARIFSKISRGVTPPDHQNWGGFKPPPQTPPRNERPPSHFFRASAAAVTPPFPFSYFRPRPPSGQNEWSFGKAGSTDYGNAYRRKDERSFQRRLTESWDGLQPA